MTKADLINLISSAEEIKKRNYIIKLVFNGQVLLYNLKKEREVTSRSELLENARSYYRVWKLDSKKNIKDQLLYFFREFLSTQKFPENFIKLDKIYIEFDEKLKQWYGCIPTTLRPSYTWDEYKNSIVPYIRDNIIKEPITIGSTGLVWIGY